MANRPLLLSLCAQIAFVAKTFAARKATEAAVDLAAEPGTEVWEARVEQGWQKISESEEIAEEQSVRTFIVERLEKFWSLKRPETNFNAAGDLGTIFVQVDFGKMELNIGGSTYKIRRGEGNEKAPVWAQQAGTTDTAIAVQNGASMTKFDVNGTESKPRPEAEEKGTCKFTDAWIAQKANRKVPKGLTPQFLETKPTEKDVECLEPEQQAGYTIPQCDLASMTEHGHGKCYHVKIEHVGFNHECNEYWRCSPTKDLGCAPLLLKPEDGVGFRHYSGNVCLKTKLVPCDYHWECISKYCHSEEGAAPGCYNKPDIA